MTTLRPMALLYLIRNFEYTYGFDRQGRLMYAERQGELLIRRYEQMTPGTRRWLEQTIGDDIRQKSLWKTDTPYARYLRLHYPEIWNRALENLP